MRETRSSGSVEGVVRNPDSESDCAALSGCPSYFIVAPRAFAQSLLARHAMIGPRNCQKTSSGDRLLACLADPEGSFLEAFKSRPDLPELPQLLTAAMEGNGLIM